MKRIFFAAFLLLVASAQAGAGGAALPYTEKGYFSISVPVGWTKVEETFGLSKEEKKVFGADFTAPAGRDGIAPRISVHYYAPGNVVHRSAEKFIEKHAQPALGFAEEGERYGPVRDGRVGSRPAKLFERTKVIFVPPRSIDPKAVSMTEKFAVVPAKDGFFVLRLSIPEASAKAGIEVYESVLSSFRMKVR